MKELTGFWDRFAKLYSPLHMKRNRELYEKVSEMCMPYLFGKNVLECACGTGEMTEKLAPYALSWTATDLSSKMVDEAQRRAVSGANFAVEDVTDLSFADSSFDVVIIANALHVMPDPVKALSEIKRVLKDGGVLIAPTFMHEGKMNKVRLKLMEAAGFRTYTSWTHEGFRRFMEEQGMEVISLSMIEGKLLPECFLAAQKS